MYNKKLRERLQLYSGESIQTRQKNNKWNYYIVSIVRVYKPQAQHEHSGTPVLLGIQLTNVEFSVYEFSVCVKLKHIAIDFTGNVSNTWRTHRTLQHKSQHFTSHTPHISAFRSYTPSACKSHTFYAKVNPNIHWSNEYEGDYVN